MTKPACTRIAPGLYDVRHKGERYEIDRDSHGLWVLYHRPQGSATDRRDYWQDYATKAAALAAVAAL